MTSWMKVPYKTRQYYTFLLCLITLYLKSTPIIQKYGIFFSVSIFIFIFIRKNIVQEEEWYVFYDRTYLLHNVQYSNTPLKGTDNAI